MEMYMFLRELLELNEGAPSIHWDFGAEDVAKTLNSLIKYNNGVWKSAKQRAFLTGPKGPMGGDFEKSGHQRRDYTNMKNWFGVEADEKKDQYVIQCSGYYRFAEYGSKSVRRFEFMYVMDEAGVVKKYKLGFHYGKGTAKGSSGVDLSKTKVEWERTGKVNDKELKAADKAFKKEVATKEKEKAKAAADSQYVGEIGKWIEDVKVKIEKMVDLGDGDYGIRWMTIIKDEQGNTYNYFGYPKLGGVGSAEDIYKGSWVMRAKVKKHYVNKNGIKVTVIGYPKFGAQK